MGSTFRPGHLPILCRTRALQTPVNGNPGTGTVIRSLAVNRWIRSLSWRPLPRLCRSDPGQAGAGRASTPHAGAADPASGDPMGRSTRPGASRPPAKPGGTLGTSNRCLKPLAFGSWLGSYLPAAHRLPNRPHVRVDWPRQRGAHPAQKFRDDASDAPPSSLRRLERPGASFQLPGGKDAERTLTWGEGSVKNSVVDWVFQGPGVAADLS